MTSVLPSILHFLVSKMYAHLSTCGKFKLAKGTLCLYVLAHDVQSNEVINNTEFVIYIILAKSCKLCIDIFNYKFTYIFPRQVNNDTVHMI